MPIQRCGEVFVVGELDFLFLSFFVSIPVRLYERALFLVRSLPLGANMTRIQLNI